VLLNEKQWRGSDYWCILCRYDEGDDNMKKIIGEAMLKSKSGEKMDAPPMPPMDGL
jgi:hypothetical protein